MSIKTMIETHVLLSLTLYMCLHIINKIECLIKENQVSFSSPVLMIMCRRGIAQ